MKARLNITIDERLLVEVKRFARKNDTNVSELVEHFFKKILKPIPKKHASIIDLVEKLKAPVVEPGADLKELYYKDKGNKYGL